jgi:hypothetical protein
MLDVESSETTLLCWSCQMAFWLAVLRQLGESGMIDLGVQSAQPE